MPKSNATALEKTNYKSSSLETSSVASVSSLKSKGSLASSKSRDSPVSSKSKGSISSSFIPKKSVLSAEKENVYNYFFLILQIEQIKRCYIELYFLQEDPHTKKFDLQKELATKQMKIFEKQEELINIQLQYYKAKLEKLNKSSN